MLSYDGTAYAGWQIQAGPPTIQSILTSAVRALCGTDTRVTGASRTDSGVHALRQAVSLTTRSTLSPSAVLGALNATLPRDIRVMEASEAALGFDARRAARGKRYAYLIDTAPVPSPLLRHYAWHLAGPLDVVAMRAALAPLRGRHDFRAFRASAGRGQNPICVVRALHVFRRRDRLSVWISGDRFLHHMVRVIVGSAVDVGRGRRPPEWLGEVLASGDRRRAGPTAPAHGLVLVRVVY